MKIAGYTRISVDIEKDQDNTSIENQKNVILNFVSQHFPDAQLDFFEDRDRSGYTFEQREDYSRMRPKLLSGEYSILVVKDFSASPAGTVWASWSWKLYGMPISGSSPWEMP